MPRVEGTKAVMLQNCKEYPLDLCSEMAMDMQTRLEQLHVISEICGSKETEQLRLPG